MISLGINYSQMHDSSACIARDGELLFAVAEERLSRAKHDGRFPALAIKACLDFARVRPEQLDYIAFGWSPPRALYLHDLADFVRGRYPLSYLNVLNSTRQFFTMQHQGGGQRRFTQHFGPTKARMLFVDHHLAHAISAYAHSGFEEAAVVVVDGRGAWEATSIWHGRNGRLDHVLTIPWPNSLGLLYAAFTEYLGFQPYSDEWKVMGLAPYGRPGIDLKDFITLDHGFYEIDGPRLLGGGSNLDGRIAERLGPKRVPESEIESRYKDVAFAVQDACEQAMQGIAEVAVKKTGCRKLCLAGGVALNSKANGLILSSGLVESIFIQPAASDDGVALGAVFAPYLESGEHLPLKALRQVYLGSAYEDSDIEKVLRTYKLRSTRPGDLPGTTADLLAAGKIIGWFQGRMEFGPRALGNRSILADPRDAEMNAKVNNAVKFREWWRPFAPSLLAESAGDYLQSAVDSPFMILTSQVRPEKRSVIPSVTHVDGSARPQTVEEKANPLYWRVIKAFGERTGVPVIMNTSFNLRGEPIVCSPTDAIRTFFSSGMDALVIGDFLVEK
ncbi:MAG: carbamoyltransferase [Terriglobia bacterium]